MDNKVEVLENVREQLYTDYESILDYYDVKIRLGRQCVRDAKTLDDKLQWSKEVSKLEKARSVSRRLLFTIQDCIDDIVDREIEEISKI